MLIHCDQSVHAWKKVPNDLLNQAKTRRHPRLQQQNLSIHYSKASCFCLASMSHKSFISKCCLEIKNLQHDSIKSSVSISEFLERRSQIVLNSCLCLVILKQTLKCEGPVIESIVHQSNDYKWIKHTQRRACVCDIINQSFRGSLTDLQINCLAGNTSKINYICLYLQPLTCMFDV